MTHILLFHHAQGRTAGVQALAERLRAGGHDVTVPDLYDGNTFATLDEGIGYARQIGFGTVHERGAAPASDLPADMVYAGISLGVMSAQMLAQTRSGAKGALLLEACMPVSEFGERWPDGVPVQIHGADADPFFAEEDLPAARELASGSDDAELFTYPGDQHLFTDSSLPAYDEAATALVLDRALGLLSRLG